MATSLYDLSVPTFLQTVRAVAGFLQRAAKHCAETGADPDDLVHARLIADMAPLITNAVRDVNRVAYWVAGKGPPDDFQVEPMVLSRSGLDLLREADAAVREILAAYDTHQRIWQCPVVMLPQLRCSMRSGSLPSP